MDSSASRQVKRPRSATPSKGADSSSSPPKKKNKTTKKTKKTKTKSRSNSLEVVPKSNKPPRESQTASAQGQMMAQMLSTFSKVEQSRFEAFQRARLTPHYVSDWVAATLSHAWNLPHCRPLADLVAVGQAPEITLVVSVLAKIYAQRIVQAAVKRRDEESGDDSNVVVVVPLTVQQLKQAWQERQAQGLDPGFFLQPANERPAASLTLHENKTHEQSRLAALEAQEKYDEWIKQQKESNPQNNQGGVVDDDDDDDEYDDDIMAD